MLNIFLFLLSSVSRFRLRLQYANLYTVFNSRRSGVQDEKEQPKISTIVSSMLWRTHFSSESERGISVEDWNLPRQANSKRSENQKTGRASMEVAKAPLDRGMPKLARCSASQSRSTKNSFRSKQQRNDCNELYLFLTEILKNIKVQFHFVLFKL